MNDRVQIFDTTLRDGEQVPGCQLNSIEKIEVAKQLELLGVDVIEAGFPISSPADFKSVVEVSKAIREPIVCALSRAVIGDIDCAADSLKFAKKRRIHTFISTSDIHIEQQFKTTREDILERAVAAVKHAKQYEDDVEFSAMDAGRSDREYLARVVEAVIAAGATTINIPDTTGYCLPHEYGELFQFLLSSVAGADTVTFSAHCHNDLGLATANSYAAVANGARQVEGTINGVGERAGNAALEELVMILKTRGKDEYATGVQSRQIIPSSRLVSRLLRMPVQPNKAIVGKNAFAHSSGIHQHGVLNNRSTYEIIDPEEIGLEKSDIILTARSGKSALAHHLKRLGFGLSKEEIAEIYPRFISMADTKQEILDEDLFALMGKKQPKKSDVMIDLLQVLCGSSVTPTATVRMQVNGRIKEAVATGNGPIDAAFHAVDKLMKKDVELEEFLVQAITTGTNDTGKVSVQLASKGKTFYGSGADTDIVTASVMAYVDALQKVL